MHISKQLRPFQSNARHKMRSNYFWATSLSILHEIHRSVIRALHRSGTGAIRALHLLLLLIYDPVGLENCFGEPSVNAALVNGKITFENSESPIMHFNLLRYLQTVSMFSRYVSRNDQYQPKL